MKPVPLTRRHHLLHFADMLETNGFSSERILDRLRMPMWRYGNPDDLIPLRHALAFISEAARAVGDEKYGLLVGEANFFNRSTTIGGLVSASPTTYDAMKTLCRLAQAHTTLARLWLSEVGDTIWFCRQQLAGMHAGLRQHEQYTMAVMIHIVRLAVGPNWKPAEMWMCTPKQPGLEETDALADIHIRYDQPHGAIAVPKSIACLPIRRHATPGRPIVETMEQRVRSTAPAEDYVGSLRQVIAMLLAERSPSIVSVAEIAGVHVRVLQRRLADEGVTFRGLVERVRFDVATELLKEPGATVTDIAFELGYAEVASFSRAFRRWAGVSPREYRRFNVVS